MNPIGSTQPVNPIQIKHASGHATTPASAPAHIPQAQAPDANQTVDIQVAEQRRLATVERLSQDIANIYVVGDKRFTIFKDVTGQYITRFTSLRDGKVTYIPEPELFKVHASAQDTAPNIKLSV